MIAIVLLAACSGSMRAPVPRCGSSSGVPVKATVAFATAPRSIDSVSKGMFAGRLSLDAHNEDSQERWVFISNEWSDIASSNGHFAESTAGTAPTGVTFQRYRDSAEQLLSVVSYVGSTSFQAVKVPAQGHLKLRNLPFVGAEVGALTLCSADGLYSLHAGVPVPLENPLELKAPLEFSGPFGAPADWRPGPAGVSVCASGWACFTTVIATNE